MQILDVISKIAQIVIAITAVWASFRFYDWWKRPILVIEFDPNNGEDVQKYDFYNAQSPDSALSIRARVLNNGRVAAEFVEVVLTDLRRFENGQFQKVRNFMPINLRWSHAINPEMQSVKEFINPIYISKLAPGIPKHIDIGTISWSSSEYFEFEINTKPITRFWQVPIGKYRFQVKLAAANIAKPKSFDLDLHYKARYAPLDSARGTFADVCELEVVKA